MEVGIWTVGCCVVMLRDLDQGIEERRVSATIHEPKVRYVCLGARVGTHVTI
jgi:hypothetical protein